MDSVTALYHTIKVQNAQVVGVLSFDYGSKHNPREIAYAQHHAKALSLNHQVIALPFIGALWKSDLLKTGGRIPEGHYEDASMKQTVVPFRNGIMLAIAAGFAESVGAEALVIAAHAGDHAIYPDCRSAFMEHMGNAIKEGTYAGIFIVRPFIYRSKADIASTGARLGVDLSQTYSCYKGEETHCGRCGTCIERREAFHLAGLADPTRYAEDAPSLGQLIARKFHL